MDDDAVCGSPRVVVRSPIVTLGRRAPLAALLRGLHRSCPPPRSYAHASPTAPAPAPAPTARSWLLARRSRAMLTEYEARREARIARNRAILLELVGSLPAHREMLAAGSPAAPTKRAAKKRKAPSVPEEEQRRSGRIRNLPAPIYTTFERDEDLGDRVARRRGDATTTPRSKPTAKKPSKPAAPPAVGSIKTLDARITRCAAEYLGAKIAPPPGSGALKEAVIRELAPVANPRFSKYSGIQEWRNCVCLFVNVGDKHGNSYDNVFTHAGKDRVVRAADAGRGDPRRGAHPRHRRRAIRRRPGRHRARGHAMAPGGRTDAKAGRHAEEGEEERREGGGCGREGRRRGRRGVERAKGSPDDPRRCWPLHLFCRMEGCEYVYCGRLRLHEANARKRPMRFEFRLLDAPLLRHSDEFLGLVDLADADASLGELEAKARAASERMKQEKEARGR